MAIGGVDGKSFGFGPGVPLCEEFAARPIPADDALAGKSVEVALGTDGESPRLKSFVRASGTAVDCITFDVWLFGFEFVFVAVRFEGG